MSASSWIIASWCSWSSRRGRRPAERAAALAALLLIASNGCSGGAPRGAAPAPTRASLAPSQAPVHAWILLDGDPARVASNIAAARRYGVNQIQLSHELVYDIDDVLVPGSDERVARLNDAIGRARAAGMRSFAWAHELPRSVGTNVCYAPGGDDLGGRAQAYRRAFERLPGLDGVVLMFGSAGRPPWRTACWCAWCLVNHPLGYPLRSPPLDRRLAQVVEAVGAVVVNELGRELIVRSFVHAPEEIDWHADALASVHDVAFLGMHKAEVQDFQPHHPPDPSMGEPEAHDSIVELDAAGEYWGRSVLPFAAPEYFAFRLRQAEARRGVGAAVRVEVGSDSALGSPNEVNLLAVSARLANPRRPLASIWDEFIQASYGLAPGSGGQAALQRILSDTFEIRLKSHYVLGVWALQKSSDFPRSLRLARFYEEGKTPRWDRAWTQIWSRLDRPDEETVLWVWQEASEAVALAEASLARLPALAGRLEPSHYDDLARRLLHQALAAEAWRAMKLFIWARRAIDASEPGARTHASVMRLSRWGRWAYDELGRIEAAMRSAGLAVAVASPDQIRGFLASTARAVPDASPARPDPLGFSPLERLELTPSGARLAFRASRAARVELRFGLEAPDLERAMDLGTAAAGERREVRLSGLEPGQRYLLQLRAREDGLELRSGYHWLFTPDP